MMGIPKKFLFLFLFSILLFRVFPNIDILFSSLFYDSIKGFFLSGNSLVQFSYKINPFVVIMTVLLLICLLLATSLTHQPWFKLEKKAYVYLLIVLLIGPLFLVNLVFKDHWGRARPVSIEQFGGDKKFSPAFAISDQCQKNCSFPAGHPSILFYFMAVGLLAKRRVKNGILLASILLGFLVGLGRILQGAHFLSDVVFSFFLVALSAQIIYYLMFQRISDPSSSA